MACENQNQSPIPLDEQTTDRRTSARCPLFMQVRTAGECLLAWDIGLGGIKAKGRRSRFPGQFLDLQFTLPGTPTALHLRGQITDIEQCADLQQYGVELSIRFCAMGGGEKMAIYRFLDGRRALWQSEDGRFADNDSPAQPFRQLLLATFDDLRTAESKRGHLNKYGPSTELWRLCRALGRDDEAGQTAA